MAYDPKLTIYTISLSPFSNDITNTNRWLFRNLINEANGNTLQDSYIFGEVFRRFIAALDRPEMYTDDRSKKSITANQPNIADASVQPNIRFHSTNFIIEGTIEGGSYGRRRNKTSTINKANKTGVSEDDAITVDFYFLIYMPPSSNKMVLMIQSYTGDSVDSVIKLFWENLLTIPGVFKKPKVKRFIPVSIIEDFRRDSTVSSLKFSTEIPGESLLDNPTQQIERNFKVSVTITPIEGDLSIDEFDASINSITQKTFIQRLGSFIKRTGTLKDNQTQKTSPFDLDSNFEIQPIIHLTKYINFPNNEIDFSLIRTYCETLLTNEIIPQIYSPNAVQER